MTDPPIGAGSKILLAIGAAALLGYPFALWLLPVGWMLIYTIAAFVALLYLLGVS